MDMSHGFGCKNSDNWMDEQVITPECLMLWHRVDAGQTELG